VVDEKEQVVEVRVFVDGKGSMEILPDLKAVLAGAGEHGCCSVSPGSDEFDAGGGRQVCVREMSMSPCSSLRG